MILSNQPFALKHTCCSIYSASQHYMYHEAFPYLDIQNSTIHSISYIMILEEIKPKVYSKAINY